MSSLPASLELPMRARHTLWPELVLLASVAVVTSLLLVTNGTNVSNNSAIYLTQARAISLGDDPGTLFSDLSVVRGPLLPYLLGHAFRIWSASVEVALLVVRVLFVLSIVLTYVLTRSLFGIAAGLGATVLTVTSLALNQISTVIDTDIVFPTFCLLFFVLYTVALLMSNWLLFTASGLALGLALITKESALVFLALPVLMTLVLKTRNRVRLAQQNGLVYVGLAGITVPWLTSVYLQTGSLLPALGVASPEYQQVTAEMLGHQSSLSYWAEVLTIDLLPALKKFYHSYLAALSFLAPALVAAWLYLAIQAIRYRTLPYLLPILALLCFSPIILRIGDLALRLGQATVIFYLSYVVLAGVIAEVLTSLLGRASGRAQPVVRSAAVQSAAILGILGLPTMGQLAGLGQPPVGEWSSTWNLWQDQRYGLRLLHPQPFEARGRFTAEQAQAAAWLQANAGPDANVVADGYTHEALGFFLGVPNAIPSPDFLRVIFLRAEDAQLPEKRGDDLLYFMTLAGLRTGSDRRLVVGLVFQNDLIAQLQEHEADYFVISGRGIYLRHYLESTPWGELAHRFGSVDIYRILRDEPGFSTDRPATFPVTLHLRSGDGTTASVRLSPEYRRYEVPGEFTTEADNLYFYIDESGEFFLDNVEFLAADEGGEMTNRLTPADSAFESAGHWHAQGNHAIERVRDEAAPEGEYVLRVTATSEGGGTNLAGLTTANFAYEGGPNLLRFLAKGSAAVSFPCVNESLDSDLTWLKQNYADAYAALVQLSEQLSLSLDDDLRRASCVLPTGQTP